MVRPVRQLPVSKLDNVLVAAPLELPSGGSVWGLLGNIDAASAEKTSHFLSVSVLNAGRWFHLARYHDFDRDVRGPAAHIAEVGTATWSDNSYTDDAGLTSRGTVRY